MDLFAFPNDYGRRNPMKQRERNAKLLTLWHLRPKGNRRERDVIAFYRRIEETCPHLLDQRSSGDPYRSLLSVLRGYIEECAA
jgi:hypothetical protein